MYPPGAGSETDSFPMRFTTLADWLRWQETLHPNAIALGLERVQAVYQRVGERAPASRVITVAGTNGKGSSVAMLEAILIAAGYRVGVYTSPHLLRYNERIRIAGEAVTDTRLCEVFERIDQARGVLSLTYFEFATLAALVLFADARLDVAVLEVGMGGRLDAVNIIDADVALITPIDIDHGAWLGDSREAIAREKAGILRAGHPAVCSDPAPPVSLLEQAAEQASPLYCLDRDFSVIPTATGWDWVSAARRRATLPLPALRGRHQLDNAAGVMMVLALLAGCLPVGQAEVRQGLLSVQLPGRFQVLAGEVTRILDVAHNPHGARALARQLSSYPCPGRTRAVVGMLADKDCRGIFAALLAQVDEWHLAGLAVPRGATAPQLADALAGVCADHIGQGRAAVYCYPDVAAACVGAGAQAQTGDRLLIFGSFHTVAAALQEGL